MTYPFTKSLEHHGLVAGFCKEIDLANIIDLALGTSEHRQISFGNLFVAMLHCTRILVKPLFSI